MPLALVIHRDDNVATALENLAPGNVHLLGEPGNKSCTALEPIPRGHKLALASLSPGDAITKYGVTIGNATSPIAAGVWIHTHNCASPLDPRSATLDKHTGAPTDIEYE